MIIKFGNMKQIMISLVLLGVIVGAIMSSHISNVHLALTLFIGGLHVYLGNRLIEKKVKPSNNMPASYAYIFTFIVNIILCVAFSWWFSGIVWAYILCIYIAVNQQSSQKSQKEENES